MGEGEKERRRERETKGLRDNETSRHQDTKTPSELNDAMWLKKNFCAFKLLKYSIELKIKV